jgi:ribonuclease BN (tRNA processing enzyme)
VVHATTYFNASPAELDRHGHLPPELAADIAGRAGVRQLVLTRLAPPGPASDAAAAAAGRRFGAAPITVATRHHDHREITVLVRVSFQEMSVGNARLEHRS